MLVWPYALPLRAVKWPLLQKETIIGALERLVCAPPVKTMTSFKGAAE